MYAGIAKKCFVPTFTLKTSTKMFYPYEIDGTCLERKSEIRDLGVVYNEKTCFNRHIDLFCSKARQMNGFISRIGKDFKKPSTLVTLYKAIVIPHLEYASQIWNSHTELNNHQIEAVQHKFIRKNASRFHKHRDHEIDYTLYERVYKLDTLELRRKICDVKYVVKSFKG